MTRESGDEHRDFQATCGAFVNRQARSLDDGAGASGTFPVEVWKELGAAGLCGAGFIEESTVAYHCRYVRIPRIAGGADEIQLEIPARG